MESRRPLVYYTHWCPPEGPDLLAPTCDVHTRAAGEAASREQIVEGARDAVALCYFVPDLVDDALIAALPRLRVLAGFGKGYDNVDVAAATRRGVWVTNVTDALTESTADLAWSLLLALARKTVAGDAFVRGGGFDGWHPRRLLGRRVHGSVLGIWGFGAIGRAIARRAAGFGMTVLYHDPMRAHDGVERELQARYAERDELLREADHVVLCFPLTDATRGAVGARELALMRRGTALINVARGSVVDEDAVASAVAAGRIAGYAADVFALEDRQYADRPGAIPEDLLAQRERSVLTPHLGTGVLADRVELARAQALNVLDALAGRRPRGAVNDVA
jgi:phosphonate dehydrogenase